MASTKVDPATIVPALREQAFLPPDTVGVFASGSIVRGWGSPTSDLDIHVVTEQPHESSVDEISHVLLEPNTVRYERTFVDGMRWDIEYWTASQVDQLLDKFSWEVYRSPGAAWSTLSSTELGMLQRLPYAAAADDGKWLDEIHRRLAESAHQTILVALSVRESDGLVEDAAGQLQADDLYSAVIATRLAFNHTVDALQASQGQFGSFWPKWRARRMKLIDSPLLSFEQYWAIETLASFDADNPRTWVEEVLGVCRDITSELEL